MLLVRRGKGKEGEGEGEGRRVYGRLCCVAPYSRREASESGECAGLQFGCRVA